MSLAGLGQPDLALWLGGAVEAEHNGSAVPVRVQLLECAAGEAPRRGTPGARPRRCRPRPGPRDGLRHSTRQWNRRSRRRRRADRRLPGSGCKVGETTNAQLDAAFLRQGRRPDGDEHTSATHVLSAAAAGQRSVTLPFENGTRELVAFPKRPLIVLTAVRRSSRRHSRSSTRGC